MLDAAREIRKFRPLPVDPAEVPSLGAAAASWQELSKALHNLGMVQYRTAADVHVLLSRLQGPQPEPTGAAAQAELALLNAFMPIIDTFDLAYDAVVLLGDPGWKAQFDRFHETITSQLSELGLEHLPGVGSAFDPEVHVEAAVVSRANAEWSGFAPDTVGAVYHRGFRWQGRLLRKAQVVRVS